MQGVGFASYDAINRTHSPQFADYLHQHIRAVTVDSYLKRLKLLSKFGDLQNPELIKNIICKYPCRESFKELLTNAYSYYVQYHKLSWVKPYFTRQESPIFLPYESELNQLISKAYFRLSVFLECLKETGADSGEAWKLRWIDIDSINNVLSITPTKNHCTRKLKVSSHLISRLNQLPHKSDFIFGGKDIEDMRKCYMEMKNKLAVKLDNPRLKQIAFRSFRHWKATNEYHKTKDILHIKWMRGHRRLENTLVYTHLVNFDESEGYVCKVAHNLLECTQLIESGFDYITEMDGVKLFKKRK